MTELSSEVIINNIVIYLALLLLNAVFVSAEFAFIRLRKSRVSELIQEGRPFAVTTGKIVDNLDKMVSGAQLGITVASLALGAISEEFFSVLFLEFFKIIGLDVTSSIVHGVAFFASLLFISLSHVILGEQIPKMFAIVSTDAVALYTSWFLWPYIQLVDKPFLKPMIWMSNSLMKLLRIQPQEMKHGQVFTEEEIKIIIKDSIEKGELEEFESSLIFNIFKFTDTKVKTIKTPKFKVVSIPKGATVREIIKTSVRTGYSRFPVYEGRMDNIIGSIHVKDVLTYINGDASHNLDDPFDFERHIRKTLIIHEGKPVDDLLREMQEEQVQLAIVVDEYGDFMGIVTIEDIIEKIFGPIDDEFDPTTEDLEEKVEEGLKKFKVDAQITLEQLNEDFETLGIKLHSKESLTLAGYLLEKLGSDIPTPGTVIIDGDLKFKVVNVKSNRIDFVEIEILDDEDFADEEE